jgi:hypothetical protein
VRLQYNEILPITNDAVELANEETELWAQAHRILNEERKGRWRLGLAVEYEHSMELIRRGVPFEPSFGKANYDRIVNGILEDDKAATWFCQGGKLILSGTHTIAWDEHVCWSNIVKDGGDVLIHSFEYTSPSHQEVKYKGAISFKKLLNAPGRPIKTGKDAYYFDRRAASLHNTVKL